MIELSCRARFTQSRSLVKQATTAPSQDHERLLFPLKPRSRPSFSTCSTDSATVWSTAHGRADRPASAGRGVDEENPCDERLAGRPVCRCKRHRQRAAFAAVCCVCVLAMSGLTFRIDAKGLPVNEICGSTESMLCSTRQCYESRLLCLALVSSSLRRALNPTRCYKKMTYASNRRWRSCMVGNVMNRFRSR